MSRRPARTTSRNYDEDLLRERSVDSVLMDGGRDVAGAGRADRDRRDASKGRGERDRDRDRDEGPSGGRERSRGGRERERERDVVPGSGSGSVPSGRERSNASSNVGSGGVRTVRDRSSSSAAVTSSPGGGGGGGRERGDPHRDKDRDRDRDRDRGGDRERERERGDRSDRSADRAPNPVDLSIRSPPSVSTSRHHNRTNNNMSPEPDVPMPSHSRSARVRRPTVTDDETHSPPPTMSRSRRGAGDDAPPTSPAKERSDRGDRVRDRSRQRTDESPSPPARSKRTKEELAGITSTSRFAAASGPSSPSSSSRRRKDLDATDMVALPTSPIAGVAREDARSRRHLRKDSDDVIPPSTPISPSEDASSPRSVSRSASRNGRKRTDKKEAAGAAPAAELESPTKLSKRAGAKEDISGDANKKVVNDDDDDLDEDEKVAIRKAAVDRRRKSQYIRDKKKEKEKEKEDAEERARKKKERERKELERKDAERRLAEIQRLRDGGDFVTEFDESILDPDYIEGVIRTLIADTVIAPTPDDFVTPDGFDLYQSKVTVPLQEVIGDFLSERYIEGPRRAREQQRRGGPGVALFLKVMEATDIYIKGNGKPRECYCRIEFGEWPDDGSGGGGINTETYVTEVASSMTNPFTWNQHLDIDIHSVSDKMIVSVWDQRKDDFLGQVKLNVEDIVARHDRDGYISKWFALQPREGRQKDKYVGGDILLEFNIDQGKKEQAQKDNNRDQYLESELISAKVNFIVLYKTLLRACLALDMLIIDVNESTIDLLSNESKTLLRVFGRKWAIGEAVQFVSYVDLLFNKYKNYEIPVNALFVAYENIYNRMKSNSGWLTKYDKPALSDLSDHMHEYYRTQILKYKEFFPKNRPEGALANTILMWRMVFKSSVYRENHPDAPVSFKEQITEILNTSCKTRYEKLFELTSAIDETDLEAVVEGLVRLTQMLTDEIEMDAKYYHSAFRKDLDIVQLSVEIYSTAFLQTLDEHAEFFASAEGVAIASKPIFELLKKVRRMDTKLDKIVPGKSKINAEKLFAPFILKWLDYIGTKTVEWVANAVNADNFEPIDEFDYSTGESPHSSSVMDIFTAINHELSFVVDLKWTNQVQSAGFYQKFAKTIFTAIEQYCDVIVTGELKPAAEAGKKWVDMLKIRSQKKGPKDINSESCVKLCNIEFALNKLEDLNKIMDVASLQRTVKDYRATIAPALKQKALEKKGGKGLDEEDVKGAFSVQIIYAENIKPVNNQGLASSYATIRVPEGTYVPPPDPLDVTGIDAGAVTEGEPVPAPTSPQVAAPPPEIYLKGQNCEMARTRIIPDSINPHWDEAFTFLLPPITKLEVSVYSKNLITNDPLCGSASLDLGEGSRLKRKLADHHTHDVFLELEPQGRILLRLTLEGEEEDVEFWFRRSREKLGRTRNDFVRSLCTRISPYTKEVVVKALKDQEAAPIKKEGWMSALQKTQLSNKTVAGVEVMKEVSSGEADNILSPLTDYLNKNLDTLFSGLSSRMATEVTKRIWEDSLLIIESALIPQLFGPIEKDRRYLNPRQVSVLAWTLDILKEFFHAGGADLGLPTKVLETKKYATDMKLIDIYERELRKLKSDYEKSLFDGREKEYILRLIRLRFERQDELTNGERDEGRKWIEVQLNNRKEAKKG